MSRRYRVVSELEKVIKHNQEKIIALQIFACLSALAEGEYRCVIATLDGAVYISDHQIKNTPCQIIVCEYEFQPNEIWKYPLACNILNFAFSMKELNAVPPDMNDYIQELLKKQKVFLSSEDILYLEEKFPDEILSIRYYLAFQVICKTESINPFLN